MSDTAKQTTVNKAGCAARVPASEVKNAWHEYVDRVSQAREEIIVTRYGKPIMKLTPYEEPEGEQGVFGFMAGTVTIRGDITEPMGEVWEADA